jgi:2-dehydropantoate 2-reductase
MPNIAVVGPGAIGGIVAAWLGQNPALDITLCARTPLDRLEVETPDGRITATPCVLTDPAAAAPADWVLVCTKAYDVPATAPWLDRLVGPGTRIAVLQNGVEHRERFAGLLPPERIMPAIVDIPAGRPAPGRMVQHAYGWIAVPSGPDGEAFAALFAHTKIAVTTDPDLPSRAWQKLCLNAAGAVSALTFAPPGPMWSPELEAIIRALCEECAAVARAEGATVPQAVIESVVEKARNSGPAGGRNSLVADRLAGRPTEIDARNGVIVRLGKKHGIPTPMNQLVVTLLTGAASPWVSDA